MEASAHHFTAADLTATTHINEVPRRDEITLNLDYRQCGLGGQSCGPATMQKYRVEPVRTIHSVILRPLAAGQDPTELARRRVGPVA